MWDNIFHSRCSYCEVSYHAIGKIETFAEDLRYIAKLANIQDILTDERIGFSRNTNGFTRDEKTLKYFKMLSSTQIRDLYKLYRLDFELFGYSAKEYLN